MTSAHYGGRRLLAVSAAFAAAALVLAGCSGSNNGSGGGGTLTVGTTDKITSIDPAGSYDNGSFAVMNQVYPFLMNTPYGSPDVKPDIAESASFTSPTEYTVKLKPGLKFANGHDLTSSDVKFTFDRQLKINDPNGPASLLANLDSVSTPDKTTVVFKLKVPNDQTFPQVLSSPAGPIVDEQVFSADKVTPDNTIVKGHAFAGQYDITSYDFNNLIAYKAYDGYQGLLGKPATAKINVKYYAQASNLKLDIQKGAIDVAWRQLSATDIENLQTNKNVKVVKGPGGEIRYIVFNFNTQPFGSKTPDADPKKALAVRQAAADLVDRAAIAKQVYKDTYTPLYSFVPNGLTGATTVLKDLYGDGNGGPSLDKAKAALQAAGVTTPVSLNLQYNPDHYGPSSGDEYAQVKSQLETGGLFKVNLQSTEWVQYSKDRTADVYPAYQLGWFPDYSDADNYLSPFFSKDNFLANHYDNPEVQGLITKQVGTTDKAERTKLIEEIQAKVAADLSTLPLLQGSQVAIVGKNVKGTEKTLDASFKFRYAVLSK
ncbi:MULTISPECIES: ABC transporter substrate-binding protein [unclassified Leifsonia]|uniref:ABC transporter substrate-binding protein n=1 Tax=unclassified Leifsonia TaxID=2663824 RepID=UPI0008A7CBC8|nr:MULTISPECIES: ABC transporter substrate-binding protein [unclassified Leifsonia]SEH85710.1 peptide/nickel transport system substrate-binding protein [Leifsonia sp. CL154]SFL48190.1 peptide/nickel transport system substrate-binding protein [Leifsonia sp. CL147]